MDSQGEWQPVTGDDGDRPGASAAGHGEKPEVAIAAAVTPAAVTPAAVMPAAVTPAAVMPAAVTPAAVMPAAVMPAADVEVDAKAAARLTFIEETAAALGRSWAEGRRAELRREGRPAAGGWPGTLREARGCVERELPRELRGHRMTAITTKEREIAARATYASARIEWRRRADPEEPFFDGGASVPKSRAPSEH